MTKIMLIARAWRSAITCANDLFVTPWAQHLPGSGAPATAMLP